MPVIRTVAAPITHEGDKVKGSRFATDLAPAATEDAALAVAAGVRQRWPDATHHCWAFRLSDGRERASDDGEPAGTAGAPILRHLTGADLVDVVAVVTRWYGGTKLGTGGLIRAYGGAVADAIGRAAITQRPVLTRLHLRYPYELSGAVEGVLATWSAAVESADYGASVTALVTVPVESAEGFTNAIAEATSGLVVPVDPGRP